jgi:hypothetical protein
LNSNMWALSRKLSGMYIAFWSKLTAVHTIFCGYDEHSSMWAVLYFLLRILQWLDCRSWSILIWNPRCPASVGLLPEIRRCGCPDGRGELHRRARKYGLQTKRVKLRLCQPVIPLYYMFFLSYLH